LLLSHKTFLAFGGVLWRRLPSSSLAIATEIRISQVTTACQGLIWRISRRRKLIKASKFEGAEEPFAGLVELMQGEFALGWRHHGGLAEQIMGP
jgi:hypothetical protein